MKLFGRDIHIFIVVRNLSYNFFSPIFLSSHFNIIRLSFLKFYGARIGCHTFIARKSDVRRPNGIIIGNNVIINKNTVIDGRGGLIIGDNVDIAQNSLIWTAQHDYNDDYHKLVTAPTKICDYVWICSQTILLPGITVGKGAVVASGAVVTKDVQEMKVVAGIPAKEISVRKSKLLYSLKK